MSCNKVEAAFWFIEAFMIIQAAVKKIVKHLMDVAQITNMIGRSGTYPEFI